MKIGEIYEKIENYQQAYEVVKNTESKYGAFLDNNKKKKIKFKKIIIKYSSMNKDILCYIDELHELEKIQIEANGEYSKGLGKNCVAIALAYQQLGKKSESLEYFEKAEKIFIVFGNQKIAKDIQKKKEEVLQTV